MKSPKFIVEILLCLAVLGAIFYFRYLRSDAYKVKKQLLAICDDVRKTPEEHSAMTALKTVALQNRLADHVELSVHGIPIGGGMSGEELAGYVSRARMYLDVIKVDVKAQEVTVNGDKATITALIHAEASGKNTDYKLDENYRMNIALKKDESQTWLFTSFSEGEGLQK